MEKKKKKQKKKKKPHSKIYVVWQYAYIHEVAAIFTMSRRKIQRWLQYKDAGTPNSEATNIYPNNGSKTSQKCSCWPRPMLHELSLNKKSHLKP